MNPFNMKKMQLQIYLTGYCKHRMPYAQHPKCFEKEIGDDPKIGIFDIETAWGFNADSGFMICYVINEYGTKKLYYDCITKKDVEYYQGMYIPIDKRVCSSLAKDLKRFNVLVTFNGTRFDIPYSRTRLLKHGLDFPKYGFVKHIDLYYIVKYKLKLRSNSLESACRLFGIKGKNHVDFEIWQRASFGDKKSLDYILNHCKRDVTSCTKPLYKAIIEYARKSNRSV
jgi:uncharacterized protein YprB with RNaseH-like and TPR domain